MPRPLGALNRSALLLAAWGLLLAGPAAADQATVYLGGKVYTADGQDRVVEGFAVQDGRFLAVGDRRALAPLIEAGAKVVDLGGRFVSPGLADGHLHSEGGGPGLDFSRTRTLPELLAIVRERAAGAKPDEVVVSNSDWHEMQLAEQRLPTAADIDPVSGGVPVVLVRGGHSLILNSAALARFGITASTPVPAGGLIGRDASGVLTGEIVDTAKALVTLPKPAPLGRDDLIATQKRLNAFGITAVRIPGSSKGPLPEMFRLAKGMEADGSLSLRYTILLAGPRFAGGTMEALRQGPKQDEGDEWVRIGGVKLGVDGGFEGGHFREPYVEPYGQGGHFHGVTTFPPDAFKAAVADLNREGWRVATHAVGDAAVDQVLDAYEAADRDRAIGGRRFAIEHAF